MYTNSTDRNVTHEFPIEATGTVTATVRKDGETVHTTTDVDYEDGRYSFVLPLAYTKSDTTYDVNWHFVYSESGDMYEYDETTEVEIITPILPLSQIKHIVGEDFEDDEIADIERAVRYIIQAHTGQFFGKYVGKRRISGSGDTFLRLPMRLISLASVNGNTYWNAALALRGGGWYLQSKTYGVPSIRADFDGWHENPYSNSMPIVAPYSKTLFNFIKHAEYEVDGTWGWTTVPAAVQEAARLLVNDYACGDSTYRDRFLTSMTAADWRIQFHDGAFSNTGNVRANQLLAEFVLRRGWVVI